MLIWRISNHPFGLVHEKEASPIEVSKVFLCGDMASLDQIEKQSIEDILKDNKL